MAGILGKILPFARREGGAGGVDDVSLPLIQKSENGGWELSGTMESLVQFERGNGDEYRLELSNGICNDNESPGELVGSVKVLESGDDNDEDEGGDFQDYMILANGDSVESGLSSHSNSSEFNNVVQEESGQSEGENHVPERPIAIRPGKKGTCYRCMKGNKFTDKEACIVCGAKYCCDCVVRAMGSMPEGRKCVTCIGHRIDEAKRETLGKSSRMLKRLFPALEIERIMESERTCRVNQLPPGLVFVNGQRLSQEELFLLQTCKYPPKNLKEGKYWYDKVTGLWGKEGQKPCQIISPQLTVGGHIQKEASNGNTKIFINGREITKQELFMLQMTGVKCEGTTSFWVSADGSYQEEGMKIIRGKIWETVCLIREENLLVLSECHNFTCISFATKPKMMFNSWYTMH